MNENNEVKAATLAGKTLFITGASRGIGLAIALRAARDGANIVIAAKTATPHPKLPGTIHTAAAEVEAAGGKALPLIVDIRFEEQVYRAVEQAVARFGGIDILVNNAGIATAARIEEMPVSMWDQMMAVNLRSVFLCTHFVLPIMYKQNYGKIVSTASQLAYKGSPGIAHYCAAKAAIVAFTRSLALEIGTRNVNANCVAPGATETRLLQTISKEMIEAIRAAIPKGRLAKIDDIVPAYVFLASDEARHFVGQCLSPNGGDVML